MFELVHCWAFPEVEEKVLYSTTHLHCGPAGGHLRTEDLHFPIRPLDDCFRSQSHSPRTYPGPHSWLVGLYMSEGVDGSECERWAQGNAVQAVEWEIQSLVFGMQRNQARLKIDYRALAIAGQW